MKVIAIIQARMKSIRLPGKVMKKVLGKPLIGYLLERLNFSKKINKIILATSTDSSNDILCNYVTHQGFEVYRGKETDVLDRFYQAAQLYRSASIVRITGDCPLVDPQVVDSVISFFKSQPWDYVSNCHPPSYPDGLDTEIFSYQALTKAWMEAKLLHEREHVTPYMRQAGKFKVGNVVANSPCPNERWTIDNEEDFILIKSIIENLYRNNSCFTMDDIIKFKIKNQNIFLVNKHIHRNEGYKI